MWSSKYVGAAWWWRAAVGICLLGVTSAHPGLADEVTVKGAVLSGAITAIGAAGIIFEPDVGKGALAIKWEDIEDLKSDGAFQVLYAGREEQNGPLEGLRDGTLMVGGAPIDVAALDSGVPVGAGAPSFNDRMRSAWRYWDGNFDVGVNVQQSTTDTTGFLLGFNTVRTKAPTTFTLGASYRYATEKQKGESKSTTQDQVLGLVRGDYSFTPRVYGYASADGTYDGIQSLSIRAVPKVGLGYVFWQQELENERRNFLQGEVGPAWVYERYFGGDDSDHVSIAFGALAGYHLPYGAHFGWRLDYLPAVDAFTDDYLLRTEATLLAPLIDPISAKLVVRDEYDSQPAADTDRNSLFVTMGLSVIW